MFIFDCPIGITGRKREIMSNKLVKNNGNFNVKTTGMVLDRFKGYPDSNIVNVSDSGIDVYVLMRKPSKNEIKQMRAGSEFKVKLLEMYGVIFFLLKFGNLEWSDAPYNVNLSTGVTYLQDVPDGSGYAVKIYLIDTSSGELVCQRLTSLDTCTSRELKEMVERQKALPFNKIEYAIAINNIYEMYLTMNLLEIKSSQDEIEKLYEDYKCRRFLGKK